MPTITEAARQLAAAGLPVLCIDTCILLDVIRAPLRKLKGCIKSAIELADMQAQSQCKFVASSMIQQEWRSHEHAVMAELDRHLAEHDQNALALHEACDLVGISLSFPRPSYQPAGLVGKLHDLATKMLKYAIHLKPTKKTKERAADRTVARLRPAQKGGGIEDCIIIEEYLELCRLLQERSFSKTIAFCSSNTRDYHDGERLDETLANEFAAVGLVFTNTLPWAVHELKKT